MGRNRDELALVDRIRMSAMSPLIARGLLLLGILCYNEVVLAKEPSFTGNWTIDLRDAAERKRNAECGFASFQLKQEANSISGGHQMMTADCGRMNEGGPDSVKGVVVGSTAVLVVTSERNGEIVMGAVRLSKGRLEWRVLEEVKAGEPVGDALILWRVTRACQCPALCGLSVRLKLSYRFGEVNIAG